MTKKEYILDFLKEINYAYNHPAMYDDLKRLLDEMEEEILESANCISREEVLNECISRDKAIVQLSHLLSDWDDDWNVPIRKCIETIKIVPSVSPQPCDDAVSRQAVEDVIYDYSRSCDVNYAQIMEFIDKLPSVTPTPKMGKWNVTKEKDELYSNVCICSECGRSDVGAGDYCRWCGAKMQEVQDDD